MKKEVFRITLYCINCLYIATQRVYKWDLTNIE